jgi:hypothetical protein
MLLLWIKNNNSARKIFQISLVNLQIRKIDKNLVCKKYLQDCISLNWCFSIWISYFEDKITKKFLGGSLNYFVQCFLPSKFLCFLLFFGFAVCTTILKNLLTWMVIFHLQQLHYCKNCRQFEKKTTFRILFFQKPSYFDIDWLVFESLPC